MQVQLDMAVDRFGMGACAVAAQGMAPAGDPGAAGRGRAPEGATVVAAQRGGAVPLEGEEMVEQIVTALSRDLDSQAGLARVAARTCQARCREMRARIEEALAKKRAEGKKKGIRKLAAKILSIVSLVLAAIVAAVGAVFTGGATAAAYTACVALTVVGAAAGAASGACTIAASVSEKRELMAGAEIERGKMEKRVAEEMRLSLLGQMDELAEVQARVGRQAAAVRERYEAMRQRAMRWR